MKKEEFLKSFDAAFLKAQPILQILKERGNTTLRESLLQALNGQDPQVMPESEAHTWLLRKKTLTEWLTKNGQELTAAQNRDLKAIAELSEAFVKSFYFKKD